MAKRILLAGGYGVVGAQVATLLRKHHPETEILIDEGTREQYDRAYNSFFGVQEFNYREFLKSRFAPLCSPLWK